MSGRVKIKSKDKDKKPKIDTDPRKGLVRIRDGTGFREVERGGCLHQNYLNLLEEELGTKLSIDLMDKYIKRNI